MRGATYYQEPLYAYLVAVTYRVTGPAPWHVFAWQLALGLAAVVLVHHLARRLFSETAAAAAGALAVLAPIPLMYEVTLLRDGLIAVVTLGLAALMRWTVEGPRLRWLWLGLALGAACCLKQTFVFFIPCLAVWRLATVRTRWRERLATAAVLAAGMAIALLPVVARNLAVGVAPLALTGAGPAMFPAYQTVAATPFDLMVGRELPGVLVKGDGDLLASLLPAARSFPSWWGLPLLALEKAAYTWHGYESGNNVDFYVFRQGAPVLAALPITLVVLVPLAGLGLATRRGRAWPLLVVIAGSLPTQILAAVFSRYRAAIVLALMPLAGAGLVSLVAWLRARRLGAIAAALALAAAYVAWAVHPPPGKGPADRTRIYAALGVNALRINEPMLGALYLREAVRLTPDAAWSAARRAVPRAGEASARSPP